MRGFISTNHITSNFKPSHLSKKFAFKHNILHKIIWIRKHAQALLDTKVPSRPGSRKKLYWRGEEATLARWASCPWTPAKHPHSPTNPGAIEGTDHKTKTHGTFTKGKRKSHRPTDPPFSWTPAKYPHSPTNPGAIEGAAHAYTRARARRLLNHKTVLQESLHGSKMFSRQNQRLLGSNQNMWRSTRYPS